MFKSLFSLYEKFTLRISTLSKVTC